jgi:PAS domain S-box-containing protein
MHYLRQSLALIVFFATSLIFGNIQYKICIPLTEPFVFLNDSNKLEGFDKDLVSFLEENGLQLQISHATFKQALIGLQNGRYDAVIGGVYITPKRKKWFNFTQPYLSSGLVLLSKKLIHDLNDLENKTIGAKDGATGEKYVFNLLKHVKFRIKIYSSSEESIKALLNDSVDVVITDFYNALYAFKKWQLAGVKLYPPGGFLEINPIGIAVNKDRKELLQILNQLLAVYKQTDQFRQSHKKWFGIPQEVVSIRARNVIKSERPLYYVILFLLLVFPFLFYITFKKFRDELKAKKFKEKQILEIAGIYTNLFKHIPQGIIIFTWTDAKKAIPIVQNPRATEIVRKIQEQFFRNRMELTEFVDLLDSNLPIDFKEEILSEEKIFSKTIKFGNVHINVTGIPLGNRIYSFILNDVSSENYYKQALKESQEKYKFALLSLGEGVIWIERGRIKEINPAAAEIMMVNPEKIIGKPVESFVSVDFWKELKSRMVSSNLIQMEYKTSKGQMLHVTATKLELKSTNYLILIRDITLDKKHLEEINFLMSFKDKILKSMPSAIFALSENGEILEVNSNACKYWHKEEKLFLHKNLWDEIPELNIFKGYVEKIRHSGEEISLYKVPIIIGKGKRYFNVWMYPIEVTHKKVIILKHDDITKEVQMDEQLKQTQKMEIIGELAGSLIHDFNNILAALSGTLSIFKFEVIRKKDADPEKIKSRIRNMELAISKAQELSQRLLILGRGYESKKEIIDLNEVLNESFAIISSIIPRNIRLEKRITPFPVFLLGDALNIQQIIINLVKNAIDAMRSDGGTITVAVDITPDMEKYSFLTPEKDWLRIRVSDDGPGIPEEIQSKVFEPFFSTKPKGKGTGLGLSIVYNLMKEMGGEIILTSVPGEGTTFNLFLPRIEQIAMQQFFSQEKEEIPKGEGHILLVDDDEVMRIVSRHSLELAGFKVDEAEDGFDALQSFKANTNKYKAIVLDIIMPKMNGYETYFELKKIREDIPVVIATAFKRDSLVQELLRKGASGVVQKPFKKKEIIAAVVNAIKETSSDK